MIQDALTLRGWPGRASEVSPEPWQNSPAPSSWGNQLPSETDSLRPWSCKRGRGEGRGRRGSRDSQLSSCIKWLLDTIIIFLLSPINHTRVHTSRVVLTCGPCEPSRMHRWRKCPRVWRETPWRSRSAPGRPWSVQDRVSETGGENQTSSTSQTLGFTHRGISNYLLDGTWWTGLEAAGHYWTLKASLFTHIIFPFHFNNFVGVNYCINQVIAMLCAAARYILKVFLPGYIEEADLQTSGRSSYKLNLHSWKTSLLPHC